MTLAITTGQIVRVRSRQYVVEEVIPSDLDTRVHLSCLEDDSLGEPLEVFWERELDAQTLGFNSWDNVAKNGFDDPRLFSAYFHTLRWNCVTSTDPKLFQSPYRAGIEVKSYQLEPLRKALLMPRIAAFIADDVGLGKTIEAGLIIREMLMRQKVRRVVVACPPSVVQQWREEMETRFGLLFTVVDREYVNACRRSRGYKVNPFSAHSFFIISHALLRDESYSSLMRQWLGMFNAGSMLILDEAHNAAPASGTKYAVDSQLTRMVRELAPCFEHKLFLSATPHNGHSNSFSALLEILDPQRFCRGVKVDQKQLDSVMIRRLKKDLREIGEDFPVREIIPIVISDLPEDAPELRLSYLLQQYRELREKRLAQQSKAKQAIALLVMINLQKRLLSSIEAFVRTLKVHRSAIAKQGTKPLNVERLSLLKDAPDMDDERAELDEEDIEIEEAAQMSLASAETNIDISPAELDLLQEMTTIAELARYQQDARLVKLIAWIKNNLCPNLGEVNAQWNNRRVLIFTEYTDTKGYLVGQLASAIAGSDRDKERIEVFHGGMGEQRREGIKAAFNDDPHSDPLRILIATDAAREGINLQNHCADLFHWDQCWNPAKMEQRNGRIDRRLQKAAVVHCYYFVLSQRPEDIVLEALIRKTDLIQKQLGSLTPVVEKNLGYLLDQGINHQSIKQLTRTIESIDSQTEQRESLAELEDIRLKKQDLTKQIHQLQELLKKSRDWLQLDDSHFRDALSISLEILGLNPLTPVSMAEVNQNPESARWEIPALAKRLGADPTWTSTLDTLRVPRKKGEKAWQWRKEALMRPMVFRDPRNLDGDVVHLHLQHRVVQRLLGRFLTQGFMQGQLTRACVYLTDEPLPKVIAIARLSLYGRNATRLHDEIVTVAAEWMQPEQRGRKKLKALPEGQKDDILALMEKSFTNPRLHDVPEAVNNRLNQSAVQDVAELIQPLENRAEILAERGKRDLAKRGEKEANEMRLILEQQQERILQEQENYKIIQLGLFSEEEQRQVESDSRYWDKRIQELVKEVETEPQRIQEIYHVQAVRFDPIGLVYLYPVSG